MDSFTQYDVAARRIRDLPTTSDTQKRLQKSIYQKATTFLHLHMLPLKSLPKILKHASPHGLAPAHSPRPSGTFSPSPLSTGSVATVQRETANGGAASPASSSVVSALEAEERGLRESLVVLEEQNFLLGEMVADANRRRKFDEVAALAQNRHDLAAAIDRIHGQI